MSPLPVRISPLEGQLYPGRKPPTSRHTHPLPSQAQGKNQGTPYSSWACISTQASITLSGTRMHLPQSPEAELRSKHCQASSPQWGEPTLCPPPTHTHTHTLLLVTAPFASPSSAQWFCTRNHWKSLPPVSSSLRATPANSQANLYPIPERLGESRSPPNLPAM